MQLNMPPMFDRDPFAHPFELKDATGTRETAGIALFGMDINETASSDQEEDTKISRKVIYTCAFPGCDGVFNSTSNKKRHEKLHSGEKPHRCDHSGCGKSFARKYDLKVHMRTHTKEKPYTCEVQGCAKRFSRNSSLREHERNIHNLAVGQKFRAGRGEPRRHPCSVESKPRERSESKRYEKDSKMYLPLDGQSKAQVQELVNLFKASQQGDSKAGVGFEVRTMLPRELVTNLLDIKRERTVTRCSEVKMEEGGPYQNLPPLVHHLYSTYPSGTEVIPGASLSFSGQGSECHRHHQEDAEGEQGIWQMNDLWSIPH